MKGTVSMNMKTDTKAFIEMYRKLYISQIFNRRTSLRVKWIALRGLWILRKWERKGRI